MSEDARTEWQKHIGVGERQARARHPTSLEPNEIRRTVETTSSGCIKEKVEYDNGRVDNYYTLPTQEAPACQPGYR